MRRLVIGTLLLIILTLWALPLAAHEEEKRPAGVPTDSTAIAFGIRAEGALQSRLQDASPIVEAVIQRFVPADKVEYALEKDYYYLGRFRGRDHIIEDLLNYQEGQRALRLDETVTKTEGTDGTAVTLSGRQVLQGILNVMVPDWRQLSPSHYEFRYVKFVLLGALRCLAYDVHPRHPEHGGFSGRIFLEDRSWNIVRFTGVNPEVDAMLAPLRSEKSTFRIDSWRMNAAKDRWVPALTYIEEVPPRGAAKAPLTRGQIRFWGYNNPAPEQGSESVTSIVYPGGKPSGFSVIKQLPPEPALRAEERQARDNFVDWLLQARLLGPAAESEEMLDGIIWTLLHDNNLQTGEQVRCRILLTTRLEAFTADNTIFLSRGLIDVLPDTPSLALILAHQLAHNILGHPKIDTSLALPNYFWVSDAELLSTLRFQHTIEHENAADKEAMDIIEHSKYAKQMALATGAMQGLRFYGIKLHNLIQPQFGEHVADAGRSVEFSICTRTGELFDPERADQVVLLALGSRLIMNPWDGSLQASQPMLGPERKARERADLAVRPFEPFLEYFVEKAPVSRSSRSPIPSSIGRYPATKRRPAAGDAANKATPVGKIGNP